MAAALFTGATAWALNHDPTAKGAEGSDQASKAQPAQAADAAVAPDPQLVALRKAVGADRVRVAQLQQMVRTMEAQVASGDVASRTPARASRGEPRTPAKPSAGEPPQAAVPAPVPAPKPAPVAKAPAASAKTGASGG
jgi:hypothetical protein